MLASLLSSDASEGGNVADYSVLTGHGLDLQKDPHVLDKCVVFCSDVMALVFLC